MSQVSASDKWQYFSDQMRNLLYPLIPAVVVGTVWAVAWAGSVQARVAGQRGPLRVNSNGDVVSLEAPKQFRSPAAAHQPVVACDDDSP